MVPHQLLKWFCGGGWCIFDIVTVLAGLPCTSRLPSRLSSCVNSRQLRTARIPIYALRPATVWCGPHRRGQLCWWWQSWRPPRTNMATRTYHPGAALPFTHGRSPLHMGTRGGQFWTVHNSVKVAYSKVVHWRRNISSVPSGKAGRAFVSEMVSILCRRVSTWVHRYHSSNDFCLHCCYKSPLWNQKLVNIQAVTPVLESWRHRILLEWRKNYPQQVTQSSTTCY